MNPNILLDKILGSTTPVFPIPEPQPYTPNPPCDYEKKQLETDIQNMLETRETAKALKEQVKDEKSRLKKLQKEYKKKYGKEYEFDRERYDDREWCC